MDKPDAEHLARRLSLADAVTIGLGAMLGAGIFAAPGPAAESAGSLLLVGLAIAGLIAYANAMSSAQLAVVYPESGGTYVYAGERLGPYWGFLAGWGFVVGKTASLAAMALTLGSYSSSDYARPIAIAAVVALTAVNYLGVEKTAALSRILVIGALSVLALTLIAAIAGPGSPVSEPSTQTPQGFFGVLRSAGLLFFALAGYARIATLGEEVVDPTRTIPRAISIALGIVVVVYASVLGAALAAVGPGVLAGSETPLAEVFQAGWAELAPVVRVGAVVASAGVLLSLLAGVSRTVFSMARKGDLPRALAAVHPRYRTPHHAELAAGIITVTVIAISDLRGTIGFSSFAVLGYYALTNASALTLPPERRLSPRWVSIIGLVGCVVLAFCLPVEAVIGGIALLAIGSIAWLVSNRKRRP